MTKILLGFSLALSRKGLGELVYVLELETGHMDWVCVGLEWPLPSTEAMNDFWSLNENFNEKEEIERNSLKEFSVKKNQGNFLEKIPVWNERKSSKTKLKLGNQCNLC